MPSWLYSQEAMTDVRSEVDMEIPIEDFKLAIQKANEAGKRGKEINIIYVPCDSATKGRGHLLIDEYTLTATGGRAL
jgi:hypothetical protein